MHDEKVDVNDDWARRIDRAAELHRDALLISDHVDNLLGIAREHVNDLLHILDQPIEHNTGSDRCPAYRARQLCSNLDTLIAVFNNFNFELSDIVNEQHFLIDHLSDSTAD